VNYINKILKSSVASVILMTKSLNKTLLAVSLIMILGSMVAMIPSTLSANAREHLGPVNVKDDFKLHIDKVNGGLDIDFTGAGGASSGGNASVGIDQLARDGVAELRTQVADLTNRLDASEAENQLINQNLSRLETERVILTDRVGQMADIVNTQTEQIAELNATLQNAVIDISVNQSSGGGGTLPPVNDTGGVGGNETGNQSGGGFPPINETNGGNNTGGIEVGNQTEGNFTG